MKLCWTAIAALGSLAFGMAEAGTLKVSPIKVFLPADGKSEVIHIKNPDPTPALVQVQAVEWVKAEDLDQAERAEEILAVPPIFEMAPNSEQVIRLAHRDSGGAAVEKAYRLLITEVPEEVDPGGVAFAVRLNMPLFVTPKGAEPDPEWMEFPIHAKRRGGTGPRQPRQRTFDGQVPRIARRRPWQTRLRNRSVRLCAGRKRTTLVVRLRPESPARESRSH